MKKKAIIILCAVLAVLIAGGAVGYSFLPHPLRYKIRSIEPVGSTVTVLGETADSVTIRKEGDGEFKVLMFTDMHLDGKNETCDLTVKYLVENVQKEKPDLVLLGGDNVTSGMNKKRSHQLAEIFEKLGVYWGGVLGNHEGDNKWSVTRTEMVNIFSSYDHCLMRRGLETVTGDCNYVINIENADGSLLNTFYFLDSFDEMTDAQKSETGWTEDMSEYDGPKADQVAWYSAKVSEAAAKYGLHDSIMVIHIPLLQMRQNALPKGEFSWENPGTDGFLYGAQRENVCCTGFENGLFDAVKAGGSTKTVFCGHDHVNNFGIEVDGILLSYIEMSGYSSYSYYSKGYPEEEWLQGCTELLLHADGTFTQTQLRNNGQK